MRIPTDFRRLRSARILAPSVRYAVEALERRTLLTTFIVNNINDDFGGSLRSAIEQANGSPGLDIIKFQIPGTGVHTIMLASPLPPITDPVEIHGETQPDYAGQPLIELDGSDAGGANGLEFHVGGNLVEGLDIHSFAFDGIVFAEPNGPLATGGNTVVDNYIGTDPTGTKAEANNFSGIELIYSPDDQIDDNLISGNIQSGIFVGDQFSSGTQIYGNMIGTDVTGLKALGNGLDGVALGAPSNPSPDDGFASDNFVGGATTSERNIISGNGQSGVWIEGGTANTVQGNYIGVGADGQTSLGNGTSPAGAATFQFGTSGISIDSATNNQIGGNATGDGNLISANVGDGVDIRDVDISDVTASGNVVDGNLIGTNAGGTAAVANGGPGVAISEAPGNIIGGTTVGARNVISGNMSVGVDIEGSSATGNKVEGNYIGTDPSGLLALPNVGDGIFITVASGNIIGGSDDGARNVISGNLRNGVEISSNLNFVASANQVLGNYIGINFAGLVAMPNGLNGLDILNSSLNVIGGTTAAARNVISGNTGNGVVMAGSNATGNILEGNYVGTDSTGMVACANGANGVLLTALTKDDGSSTSATANFIGGTAMGTRNVISGNGNFGVELTNLATGNIVEGDYIGLNASGNVAIANGADGVAILEAPGNFVGGTTVAARNVISGNKGAGVALEGPTATGNTVEGNYIGTDAFGILAVPNVNDGISIDGTASGNIIGGSADGARNVISGNLRNGVEISGGLLTSANQVLGNYIGINFAGLVAMPNTFDGVDIFNSPLNVIGGTTDAARNVISGNTKNGVVMAGSNATGNILEGNYIGTDFTGLAACANGANGVLLTSLSDPTVGTGAATGNVIGGTGAGRTRNVISGNGNVGVELTQLATGNIVEGDYIGLGANGNIAIANGGDGVFIFGAQVNNIIGGSTAAAGNVISGNTRNGVEISGSLSLVNQVLGNYIGTDATGLLARPNLFDGLDIFDAPRNVIGGTTAAARNVISGNTGNGIVIAGSNAHDNIVEGNFVGTDFTGVGACANGSDGVYITVLIFPDGSSTSATGNTIGGTTAGTANVISDNGKNGVEIANGATGNTIEGDYIGVDNSGFLALPNGNDGVLIISGASGNTIGGSTAAAGNLISGNAADGIQISGATTNTNKIFANFIGIGHGGLFAIPNGVDGVDIFDAPLNVVGGAAAGIGNVISGNKQNGIVVAGGNAASNSILGNHIGTIASGLVACPNGADGVLITSLIGTGGAHGNFIGNATAGTGNLISGNGKNGVEITLDSDTNTIEQNLIGTDVTGNAHLANGADGVVVADSSNNIVGSDSAELGNIISGNTADGVLITGQNATSDSVLGNFIGLGLDGVTAVPNLDDGVLLDGAGVDTIGGTTGGEGNVISSNVNAGIAIQGGAASFNLIAGNLIGVDFLDERILPRGNGVGILITNHAFFNSIGSASDLGSNVISNNLHFAILLNGSSSDTTVTHNFIGANNNGDQMSGQGDGIAIVNSSNNKIGTSSSVFPANVIANTEKDLINNDSGYGILISGNATGNQITGNDIHQNAGDGIRFELDASGNTILGNSISQNTQAGVDVDSGTGNAISGNNIFGNGGLGIDLAGDGVTPNDAQSALDADTGANNLQNFPVLTLATTGGSNRVVGTLSSAALTTYTLDFFSVTTPDPSGFGEGDHYMKSLTVTTNASGLAPFDVTLPDGGVAGTFISATATDPNGNTSEFSNAVKVETDFDGDGISDATESGAPNGGDGNHDGILDSQQDNVASFKDYMSGQYVTLQSPTGTILTNVAPVANPSPNDAPGVSFDLGFFSFTVSGVASGGAVNVQLFLPSGIGSIFYERYGPLPGDSTPGWYDWGYDGETGAEPMAGDQYTLHFVDGKRGDDDLTANGTIVDPGGPAFPVQFTVTNTNDSGPGSLRQAILDVDSNPGNDLIDFNIGTGGVQTIFPLSPLPTITDAVTIDGTTQPGYAGTPIIVIDGQVAPASSGLVVNASDTTIRGLVVNGFSAGFGIVATGALAGPVDPNNPPPVSNVTIAGDYIGTDVTGLLPRPNKSGILLGGVGGSDFVVGGTSAADRNVISGNVSNGIFLTGGQGFNIEGNFIGVGSDGVTRLGNGGDGVHISTGAFLKNSVGVVVGGLDPGDGNVIAYNIDSGIFNQVAGLGQLGLDGYSFLSNSIHDNGVLGIALVNDASAILNDSGLTDGTSGNAQNYPVLSSAISAAGQTIISGYLNSLPDQTFVLQFFSNPTVTPSGFGQGQTVLGATSVTTDDNGHADFTATLPVTVSNGSLITATATSPDNNTSEFSVRLAVGDVLGNVYVVNTTDDTDDGVTDPAHMTLRDAIFAADNHPGLDTIEFDIPGGGVQTITPLVPLPAITDSVVIDGTSQPGYAGTPLIQIVGTKEERTDFSASPTVLTGLFIDANNSTVKGLDINSFFQLPTGITAAGGSPLGISGNNNVLEGNFIGTDVTGTLSKPNLQGIGVSGSGNRIGGTTPSQRNIISGNYENGVTVRGTANVIEGNFIGTDITGTKALGNGIGFASNSYGVSITGSNILGGSVPGAGNIISANLGDGVVLHSAEGSVIQGNFIGTDVTGTKMLGNAGGSGLDIQDNDFPPGVGVTIGGTQPGEGNIISSNGTGIEMLGDSGDVIQGNMIGTDITGTLDFGNFDDGIDVAGNSNTIGGSQPGAGNLISGNNDFGIAIAVFSTPPTGNVIQGNRIGTQADGVSPLGNGSDGIVVEAGIFANSGPGPTDNLIGGTDSGDANIIAFNGGDGVAILNGLDIGILSNSIFSNSSLGIDLNGDGPTANDTKDGDSGPNNLQNFPVLATVVTDGAHTTVTGSLNSTPDTVFMLQFFANATADPSGFGQGQTLLGTRQVVTDSSGSATFTLNFSVAVPVGQFISATATDALNNTSEFSADIQVTGGTVTPNQPPTAIAGGPYTINEGDSLKLDASRSADPDGDPLTYSWDINGDGVFGDATGAKPTLTWTQLQALGIVNGPSSFNVRVHVDDGQGHVVTSSVTTLTVLNVAPIVNAGPDLDVNEEDIVSLTGTFTDPGTADTHTLNWHVDTDNGQVISDGIGTTFSFVPNDNGTYVVTFSVTDSDGATGTAVVNVEVDDVAPVSTIVGLPAQGVVGVSVDLTSTATDVSPIDTAAGFQYDWEAYREHSRNDYVFGDASDFSFTPDLPGTYDIYFSALDKDGLASDSVATLVVVNTTSVPPTAGDDTYSTNEDTTLTITATGVLGNDSAPAGESLAASLVRGPSHGVLTLDANGDGGFVYVPNSGYAGPDSFIYQATDTDGLSANATVNLTVTAVAPTAANDGYSTNENSTLTITAPGVVSNDTAPAGESLTASLVSGPSHGVLTLDANGDGGFKYVPATGYSGPDSFIYKATDTNGLSANATVNLTVTAVAPAAANDVYSTNEDATLTVAATGVLGNDSVPAGESLTASLVSGPSHGVLTLDANGDGGFKYVPTTGYAGPDSFIYKATDTNGLSINATVNLTVTAVAPTAANDIYSSNEDTTLTVSAAGVLGNDSAPAGESLSTSLVSGPGHGVLTLDANGDGGLKYVPNAGYAGPDSFIYKATDTNGLSVNATVNLTVTAIAPTAVTDSYNTNEDTTLTVAATGVLSNDSAPTGETLTASLVSGPSHGVLTFDANGDGGFKYVPSSGYAGPDSFVYKVTDTNGLSANATANLTVTAVAPTAANDTYGTNENTTLTVAAIGVLGNDSAPVGESLKASLVSGPSHGVLTLDANGDGGFKYVPTAGYAGPDSFIYKATDTNGLSTNATVDLTVTAVAPTAGNDAYSTNEDTTLTVSATGVLGNDSAPAGESLTASSVSGPAHGVLTLDANGDGGFKYVPTAGYAGPDSFIYKATDTNGLSTNATVNLTVTAVAPTVVNDGYTTNENTTLTIAATGVLSNDSVPAGESLTASLVTGTSHGVLTLDANGDGGFKYVPTTGYAGPDSFIYKATDTNGLSANATVNLTVSATGTPTAKNDSYNTNEDTTLSVAPSIGVLANDVDPNSVALTASLVAGPTHGKLTFDANGDGGFVYVPTAGYAGPDSFTYQATDSNNLISNVATVNLTVTAVAPIAANDSYTTKENTTLTIAAPGVLSNDSAPAGESLAVSLVSGPSHGVLTLDANGDGGFKYVPNTGYAGPDSFVYKATDTNGLSANATVNLTVTAVAPTTVNDTYSTNVNTTLTIAAPGVLSNDSAPAGELLTVSLVSGPSHGVLTLDANGDGGFKYAPTAGYVGSDSFVYKATDTNGQSANATVNLTVLSQAKLSGTIVQLGAAVEGQTVGGTVATFTDPNGPANITAYSATITWGDGASSIGSIAGPDSHGVFTVTASHLYIEDGNYTEKVILSDGVTTTTLSGTVKVTEAPITATGGAHVTATAGLLLTDSSIATFVDGDTFESLSGYKATINWGDGTTTTGAITGSAGHYTVAGNHTYSATGNYTAKITIFDGDQQATARTVVTVNPSPLTAKGVTVNGQEGRVLSATVATFTDTKTSLLANQFTATINWGDGTTSAGTVVSDGAGAFHVMGSHAYAEENSCGYAVQVVIIQTGGPTVTVKSLAQIADSPLDQATGVTLTQSANVRLTDATLGIFRDQDALNANASDYVGTINWGDGTTSSAKFVFDHSVSNVGGYWIVQGGHTYTTRKTYTVKITLYDLGSTSSSAITITTTIKVI